MPIHHAKKRGHRQDHGYHYFFPDWKEELGWFNLGENMWAKEPGEGECIGVCFRLASWWEGHDELAGIIKAPKKRRT